MSVKVTSYDSTDSDSTTDKRKDSMPKFDAKNFSRWQKKCRAWFYRKPKIVYTLQNDHPIEPEAGENSDDEDYQYRLEQYQDAKRYYDEGNNYLWSVIASSIIGQNEEAEGILENVPDGDGKTAWTDLLNHFKEKTTNDVITDLIGQFQSIKIKKGQSIINFLDAVEKLRNKLINYGHRISDQDLISRIRQGLVSKENMTYRELAINLQMHPIDDYKTLIRRLRGLGSSSVGMLLSSNEETKTDSIQLAASKPPFSRNKVNSKRKKGTSFRNRSNKPKHDKRADKDIKCFRCDGKGHIASECKHSWERIQQMKSSSGNKSTSRKFKKVRFQTHQSTENDESDQFADYEDSGPLQQKGRDFGGVGYPTNDETNFVFDQEAGMGTLDSGCTVSITPEAGYITNYEECLTDIQTAKSGSTMTSSGHGRLGIIPKCKHVDHASRTLVSISQLDDLGYKILFGNQSVEIYKDEILLSKGKRVGGLYEIPLTDLGTPIDESHLASTASGPLATLAHKRLAHSSIGLIQKAVQSKLVTGIKLTKSEMNATSLPGGLCDGCASGKSHRRKHRHAIRQMLLKRVRRANELGELVVADFSGPHAPEAIITGNRYILGMTDVASRHQWDSYGPTRDEDFVIQSIQKVVMYLHSKGKRLQHYHADGGKELVSRKVLEYLQSIGATWTFNSPYTPEDNPFQERSWRTTKERALSSLIDSGLPPNFWEQASRATIHIKNRLPCQTAKGFMSPLQFIENEIPDLSYARIWGCKCFVNIDSSLRKNNWDRHSWPGYFMGYREDGPGYIVFVPALRDFVISGHVFFNECVPPADKRYFKEINEIFRENETTRTVESFKYLIGLAHVDPDDGLTYVTTQIKLRKGLIAAYRGLVDDSGDTTRLIQLDDPIHAADVEKYTEEYIELKAVGLKCITSRSKTPIHKSSKSDQNPDTVIGSPAPAATSRGSGENLRHHDAAQERISSHRCEPTHSDAKIAKTRPPKQFNGNLVPNPAPHGQVDRVHQRMAKRGNKSADSSGDWENQGTPEGPSKVRATAKQQFLAGRKSVLRSRRMARKRVIVNIHKLGDGVYTCDVNAKHVVNHMAHDTQCISKLHTNNIDIVMHAISNCDDIDELTDTPKSVQDAISGKYKQQWIDAINREISTLQRKGCWRYTALPPGARAIKGKLIFKIKRKQNDIKFKARLVAQGFTQIQGIDYNDTYSPVAKATSLRTIIALSTIMKLKLHQIDFTTAYINADLEEDIYMYPPPGMDVPDGKVLKLMKSIYGLKQAGLNWYKCCTNFMLDMGFTRLISDPCIFKKQINGRIMLIAMYVDDIIIASTSDTDIQQFKDHLSKKFEITDLGLLYYYLWAFPSIKILTRISRLSVRSSMSENYWTNSICPTTVNPCQHLCYCLSTMIYMNTIIFQSQIKVMFRISPTRNS